MIELRAYVGAQLCQMMSELLANLKLSPYQKFPLSKARKKEHPRRLIFVKCIIQRFGFLVIQTSMPGEIIKNYKPWIGIRLLGVGVGINEKLSQS